MKKLLIISFILLLPGAIFAQNKDYGKADFRLGNGLDIQLNNGDYSFNIGGFMQPNLQYLKEDNKNAQNRFGIKYGFFSLGGKAVKEKVDFLIQLDFAKAYPLMDAWMGYHPSKYLDIYVGQRQTFTNNREMTLLESKLSMNDRSLVSKTFSETGREFGLFFESHFKLGEVGFIPQAAITSGDGRNSFGASSVDVDFGGLKFGGRLDICPLGFFTKGNDKVGADLAHETTPKIKIGLAGSYTVGASNKIGEGHGDFTLFDSLGKTALPDYRKFYTDVMFKYQGFSLLAEYANTSATRVKGLFTTSSKTSALVPGQISSFLYLGNSYNIQMGYVTKKGCALDLRYSQVLPEFNKDISSLKKMNQYDATLSKYFVDNRLKIQGGVSYLEYPKKEYGNMLLAEVLFQVIF